MLLHSVMIATIKADIIVNPIHYSLGSESKIVHCIANIRIKSSTDLNLLTQVFFFYFVSQFNSLNVKL